jgi:hypothetical protein
VTIVFGNVSRDNSSIGDQVIYVTSSNRGHWGVRGTNLSLVAIQKFTKKMIVIKFNSGNTCRVTENHLFKLGTLCVTECKQAGVDNKTIYLLESLSFEGGADENVHVLAVDIESDCKTTIDIVPGDICNVSSKFKPKRLFVDVPY